MVLLAIEILVMTKQYFELKTFFYIAYSAFFFFGYDSVFFAFALERVLTSEHKG